MPLLEFNIRGIPMMVDNLIYSILYLPSNYLFPYCLCNIGGNDARDGNGSNFLDEHGYNDLMRMKAQ